MNSKTLLSRIWKRKLSPKRTPIRNWRLQFERLEEKINPSTLDFNAGVLTYTADAGETNNLTVSVSGTGYIFNDSGASAITLTSAASAAGWKGGGTKTVGGPTASVTSIAINLDDMADVFNLRGTNAPIAIDGGAGNDTINISSNAPLNTTVLSTINGDVTVTDNSGNDTLWVSDQGASTGNGNVVISGTSIAGLAGPTDNKAINFTGSSSFALVRVTGSASAGLAEKFTVNNPSAPLRLDTNAGNDSIYVQAISAAATINAGAGTDLIDVASNAANGADPTAGDLGGIAGNLSIDGGTGLNTILLDNYAAAAGSTATISGTAITGLAGGAINYKSTGGTSTVQVDGSNANGDSFSIAALPAGVNMTVNGNGGDDSFTVTGATNANLNGGAGSDSLSINDNASVSASDATGFTGANANVAGFTGIDTLTNTGGTQTLTGENAASTWALAGTQTYSDGPGTLSFANYTTLQGGNNADAFNVNASQVLNLLGGDGNDTFNLGANVLTGNVDGQAGSDTLNVNDSVMLNVLSDSTGYAGANDKITVGFMGIDTLNNNGGTAQLTGEDKTSTWALAAAHTYSDGGASTLTFSGFTTLQGGSQADAFNVTAATTADLLGGDGADVFSIGAVLTGKADGQADSDTLSAGGDTSLSSSGATGFTGVNANVSGNFLGIDTLIGSGKLTGETAASVWALAGATQSYNDGSHSLAISGYSTLQAGDGGDTFNVAADTAEILLGGAGADTFNLGSSKLSGSIAGGAGNDTLNVDGDVGVASSDSSGFTGTNALVTGNFAGIDILSNTNNASATLTGEPANSTWALGGTQTYGDGVGILTFSDYTTLQGGSKVDTFNVTAATAAALLGGDGDDVFSVTGTGAASGGVDGQAGTDTLNVGGNAALVSSGANGFTGTNASANFAGIDVLNGSGTLTGEDADSIWTLGATTLTYTDTIPTTLTFSGYGALQGGNGADTFNVNANQSLNLSGGAGNDLFNIGSKTLTGTVDGQGGSDTLAVNGDATLSGSGANGYAGGTAGVSAGFVGIDTLNGSGKLTGENKASAWAVGGTQTYNDGSANSLTFSGYANLQGGSDVDTFTVGSAATANLFGGAGADVFNINAALAGNVDGQADLDTLNVAGNATLTGSDATGYGGTNGSLTGFAGIDTLVGSGTLTGEDKASTWGLAAAQTYNDGAANSLTISGYGTLQAGTGGDTFNVTADTAEILLGGTGADAFNLNGSKLTGSIDGGAGADSLTVNGSALLSGSVANGYAGTNANVTAGFAGINTLAGTGTLTGEDLASTWALGASQTYNDGAGNGALTISGYGTLQGGSKADTFNVSTATAAILLGGAGADVFNITAALTGSVDGQADSDTLNVGGDVTLTGSPSNGFSGTNTNVSTGFAGIDTLTNNSGNPATLTGENVASTWTLAAAAKTYQDLANTLAFLNYTTLQGGSDVDTFNVSAASTKNLNGGGGADVFNITAALAGSIDGGAGSDTLNVGGDASLASSGANGFSGGTGNVSGGFAGIDVLSNNNGGSAQLTGENVAGTWTLGATQNYSDGAGALPISGYTKLQAGTAGDTFAVTAATMMTLLGGSGNDTFNIGAALTGSLSGNAGTDILNVAGDVTLNASNATGFGGTNVNVTAGFGGIDTLNNTGAAATLTGQDKTSTWTLDSTQKYSIGGTSLTFTGYGNLQGGTQSDTFSVVVNTTANLEGGGGDDVFTIDAGKTLTGTIDGQAGSNTLNASAATATGVGTSGGSKGYVGVITTNTFDNIENLSIADTVTGSGAWMFSGGAWTLNGTPVGTPTNVVGEGNADTFDIEGDSATNVSGGGGDDTIILGDGVAVTGTIDGGTGNNTLNFANGGFQPTNVVLTGASAGGFSGTSSGTSTNSFTNFSNLVGSSNGATSIKGLNTDGTWTIGATSTYETGGFTLTFSGFTHIIGGTGADTYSVDATTAPAGLDLTGDTGGANLLTVNDTADTAGESFAVADSGISVGAFFLLLDTNIGAVNIDAGSGDDDFQVNASPTTKFTFDGGAGSNTMTAHYLTLGPTPTVTGTTSGSVTNTGYADIDFTNMLDGGVVGANDL